HRGHRLHRRTPPLGVSRRAPGRGLPQGLERARAPPRSRARRARRMNDVPLFPLNTVLFPGGRLPLRIFEQRYMEMAKACLRDGSPFGVCLIREGRAVGTPAVPAGIGPLAHTGDWDMPQLGVLQVTAVGEQRFRILERRVQPNGLTLGTIELIAPEADETVPQSCAGCVKLLERVI